MIDIANSLNRKQNQKITSNALGSGLAVGAILTGGLAIALATGPETMGIGAGAALGGMAVILTGLALAKGGYVIGTKVHNKRRQKRLQRDNPELSDRGIYARIFFEVKKEVANPKGPQTISEQVVGKFFKMSPEMYMAQVEQAALHMQGRFELQRRALEETSPTSRRDSIERTREQTKASSKAIIKARQNQSLMSIDPMSMMRRALPNFRQFLSSTTKS